MATATDTIRSVQLACGHRRNLSVGSDEDLYAQEQGLAICRKEPKVGGEAVYVGINGWEPQTTDAIVGWLEQQPGAESYLQQINAGHPAAEVLATFKADMPAPKPAAAKPASRRKGQRRTPAEKVAEAKAKRSAKGGTAAASRARKPAASLPNKVRLFREKQGQSPKELAQVLGTGWTASTVRRIERGARTATVQQMAELGKALGQPASTLFGDAAAMPKAAKALPAAPAEPQTRPARKPAAAKANGKVVGKRTGKVLATKQDVKDEIGAILAS